MDTAFYTYLKLLLLSGQTSLNSTSSCRLWVHASTIRTLVDKGNSPPLDDQGGRFDFTADTGAKLKYREGYGLELQGAPWRSDLRDFEEVAKGRDKKSTEELREALDLYGEGVDFQSWKEDRITIDCKDWIDNRLEALKKHRDDIQAELDSRADSGELADRGSIETALGERPEGWSEEGGIPHVISGLENNSTEVESGEFSSTVLRDPLCQEDEPNEQVDEAVIDETEGSQGLEQETEPDREGAPNLLAGLSDTPSEVGSDVAKQETTASERDSDLRRKRNVTALGVLVSAVVLVVIFASGYLIGSGRQAPSEPMNQGAPQDQGSPQSNLEQEPNVTTPGGTTLGTEDPVEETPIVRAPENPVSLNELFLRNIRGNTAYHEEDMVIGRQLFPHYVYSYAGGDCVSAYKLAGQFRKVTCIVGVADENESSFEDDRGRVLFEGDGKILKRLEVQPGQAVSVSLEVTGIKVLVISFRFPVVIASPKAFR